MTNGNNGNWTAIKPESPKKCSCFISNVFYIQTHKSLFMPAILCFYNVYYITVFRSKALEVMPLMSWDFI